MFHLVFIKTNERRGGYVKNIHIENVSGGSIKNGVLGIETDVLYQWRDLVPTIERKLTPIEDVYLKNVKATKAEYLSKITGQEELPVKNIVLDHVEVDTIIGEKFLHENVLGLSVLP